MNYDLKVHLDPKAPVGYINDYLMLVINDDRGTQIPVLVEGRVDAGITVSPAALFMGVLQPGQKVTKQLIVKSKKPFKILAINCDEKSFEFDISAEQDAQNSASDSGDFYSRGRHGKSRENDQDRNRPG